MAPQSVAETERPLQIDHAADRQTAEIGPVEGLREREKLQCAVSEIPFKRQTAAVYRDAFTELRRIQTPGRTNPDMLSTPSHQFADRFHQPRKHRSYSLRKPETAISSP